MHRKYKIESTERFPCHMEWIYTADDTNFGEEVAILKHLASNSSHVSMYTKIWLSLHSHIFVQLHCPICVQWQEHTDNYYDQFPIIKMAMRSDANTLTFKTLKNVINEKIRDTYFTKGTSVITALQFQAYLDLLNMKAGKILMLKHSRMSTFFNSLNLIFWLISVSFLLCILYIFWTSTLAPDSSAVLIHIQQVLWMTENIQSPY